MTEQNESTLGASELSDQLAAKTHDSRVWYLKAKVAIVLFGTAMSWPISYGLSIAIGGWHWFPAGITAAVFYAFIWSGFWAADDLANKATDNGG